MSQVFLGDSWKYPKPEPRTGPTRAQEQDRLDAAYVFGSMTLEEWQARTDKLSEPTCWCAEGKL